MDRNIIIKNIKNSPYSLILILLLGFYFRIYKLGTYSLWYDEALALLQMRMHRRLGLMQCLFQGKTFIVKEAPLFDLLLYCWSYISESELLLRIISVIFGTLAIIVIYKIGKELFNKMVGLISAFILATSPFHIYYSQEIRSYALLTFAALMSIYCFIKSLQSNNIISWASFIIFNLITIYTHNIGLFLILAEDIFFLLFFKKYKYLFHNWLVSQFIIFLIWLPWLIILVSQMLKGQIFLLFHWIPQVSWESFIHTFSIFNMGYNASKSGYVIAVILFLPFFLFSILTNRNEKVGLLLIWLFFPIILTIAMSKLMIPIYVYRGLIYISPAYYLLIALGISKIRKNFFILVLIFCIGTISLLSLKNYYHNLSFYPNVIYRRGIYLRKDQKKAAEYIKENFKEGDIILHTCLSTFAPFFYYHNGELNEKRITQDGYTDEWLDFPTSQFSSRQAFSNLKVFLNGYKRVWLILASWELNELNPSFIELKQYFSSNYSLLFEKKFVGIETFLFKVVF